MSDSSDRGSPGLLDLVLSAAFVPDGEEPPAEFLSVFDPLKFSVTLDPATGTITCDNVGMSFGGDIPAEWHPDEAGDAEGGNQADGPRGDSPANDGADGPTPDRRPDPAEADENRAAGVASSSRSDGRTPFGLAATPPRGISAGQSPSLPRGLYPNAVVRDGGDQAVKPSGEAAAPDANAKATAGIANPAIQPGEAEQPDGSRFADAAAGPASPSGQLARAVSATATDAGGAGGEPVATRALAAGQRDQPAPFGGGGTIIATAGDPANHAANGLIRSAGTARSETNAKE